MKIEKNKVVGIHYTLTDDEKNQRDTSKGKDPLYFIQGIGNLIIGLEEELEGKALGDKFVASIAPEKGYGVHNPELIQELPKKQFGKDEVKEGMQYRADGPKGAQIIKIVKVNGDNVTVDGNHELAGKTLHFDVEVMEIRDASKEELEHGHVHGPGGHQH